jgi:hypothetical protein
MMAKHKIASKRFIGQHVIEDTITITIEYEYSKLIRHLRNRAILRAFRGEDRQAGKITFEDESSEFKHKLVVRVGEITPEMFIGQPETTNLVWSTSGLNKEIHQIIAERVLSDEKQTYPDLMEQLATQQMEPSFRLALTVGIDALLLRSLDDAVLAALPHTPVKASEYDERERIPRIGVKRATRENKANHKAKFKQLKSNSYKALSENYDRIYSVVGGGTGITGHAKSYLDSATYASRYKIIDVYRDYSVNIPKETLDWIFDSAQSKKMPTNAAIALELAAQKVIPDYTPCGFATNTLKAYLRKGDKLRGINRKELPKA